MKKKTKLFILGFAFVLGLCGCKDNEVKHFDSNGSKSIEESSEDGSKQSSKNTIVVYVCGEVTLPGVYELVDGSRVKDAIAMAGGLTSDADNTAINQAAVIKDQDKIVVPGRGEAGASGEQNRLININTASKEQLMSLPGIGEAKAESIISYREKKGGFKSPEDLMKIEGIKSSVYNKVKDKIVVN